MAEQLIKIAAQRQLAGTDPIDIPTGTYDEFAARFPYDETEDQLVAIAAVFDDLTSGRVMDRLVCGDVGFGKTEVALRAAFAVAMSGKQVAVVVPTTLLSRQHFRTFKERFAGLPVRVAQASRLVGAAELKADQGGPRGRQGRHRHRHPRAAQSSRSSSRTSACWSSTRSSILASATRSGSRSSAPTSTC